MLAMASFCVRKEYSLGPCAQPMVLFAGITLAPWLHFLASNWRYVDWRLYWHRVLFLTVLAAINTMFAAVGTLGHGRAIARQVRCI